MKCWSLSGISELCHSHPKDYGRVSDTVFVLSSCLAMENSRSGSTRTLQFKFAMAATWSDKGSFSSLKDSFYFPNFGRNFAKFGVFLGSKNEILILGQNLGWLTCCAVTNSLLYSCFLLNLICKATMNRTFKAACAPCSYTQTMVMQVKETFSSPNSSEFGGDLIAIYRYQTATRKLKGNDQKTRSKSLHGYTGMQTH